MPIVGFQIYTAKLTSLYSIDTKILQYNDKQNSYELLVLYLSKGSRNIKNFQNITRSQESQIALAFIRLSFKYNLMTAFINC